MFCQDDEDEDDEDEEDDAYVPSGEEDEEESSEEDSDDSNWSAEEESGQFGTWPGSFIQSIYIVLLIDVCSETPAEVALLK